MNKNIYETFGCRLNHYETEVIKKLTSEVGLNNLAIVNTCAVTTEAVRQAKQKIRKLKRQNPKSFVIVTGCAAQVEAATFSSMNEVSLVLGNTEKVDKKTWTKIANKKIFKSTGKTQTISSDIMKITKPSKEFVKKIESRTRAFIEVQNGCNHRCTFCIIPFARGNSRSVPKLKVLERIRYLVDQGYKEIVLTGVDLTAWGEDFSKPIKLGNLLQTILKEIPQLPRLRLSSVDTVELDTEFLDVLKSNTRLMPHLHISAQAGDDMILKRMKRRHLRSNTVEFCSSIRDIRPDVTFGADLIAGFPTETDEMFKNSLNLIKDCGLTWLHVFPFSARNGTPAAKMPRVSAITISQRAKELRKAGREQLEEHLTSLQGSVQKVLVERNHKGRTENFTQVNYDKYQPIGQIIPTLITGKGNGVLIGQPI